MPSSSRSMPSSSSFARANSSAVMSFCLACCMMRSAGIGYPCFSLSTLTSMSTGDVRLFGLGASSAGASAGLASAASGFFSAASPPPSAPASPPSAAAAASCAASSSGEGSSTRGGGVVSGQE